MLLIYVSLCIELFSQPSRHCSNKRTHIWRHHFRSYLTFCYSVWLAHHDLLTINLSSPPGKMHIYRFQSKSLGYLLLQRYCYWQDNFLSRMSYLRRILSRVGLNDPSSPWGPLFWNWVRNWISPVPLGQTGRWRKEQWNFTRLKRQLLIPTTKRG